jgi:hypothetical protein
MLPGMGKRFLRGLARLLAGLALFVWFAWTAGTVYFSNLRSSGLRDVLTGAYVLALVLSFLLVRPLRRGLVVRLGLSALVAFAYVLVRPSNDREWQPDVAVAPTIAIEGEHVTVHGVRNFHYRSESDFDARWEDRTYDLAKLRSLDLVMSYWGPVEYCHTLVSFGFEGGEQLAVSVETRKEVGEGFSTFAGLYKRFELVYVFADERDVIGVRTNHRRENVYLYRIRTRPERLRELFLSYANKANELASHPEFYGVLGNSCGVNILHRVADTGREVIIGRDALLNGYWDRNLYEMQAIDTRHPFEELRALSNIDERARAAGDSQDFSRAIRAGLPEPTPWQ